MHEIWCGIDEVGRGPWAGPVLAAAVILSQPLPGITDSKAMSAKRRAALAAQIIETAHFGLGRAEVAEIDALNILEASFLAMARAVLALNAQRAARGLPPATHALIDGNRLPKSFPIPARALIRGDALDAQIGAASILAKVTRDAEMAQLAQEFPGYGWERNAGYGTAEHSAALAEKGLTPHHRVSFAPIRKILR